MMGAGNQFVFLLTLSILTCIHLIGAGNEFVKSTGDNQENILRFRATTSSSNSTWDHFVFTQQWPVSVCIDTNITHQHTCALGKNVTTWTVHGLWPTSHGSMGPNYCNNSAKFNPDALQPILGRMLKYWPNMYTDTPMNDFWEHEWTKHGTCATSLPVLGREVDYFNQTLNLNRQYDFLTLFTEQGLVPRDGYTYQLFEIRQALGAALGYIPKIQCTTDIAQKVQYLMQVEMCIDKTFNAMQCPKSSVMDQSAAATNINSIPSADVHVMQYKMRSPTTCSDNIPIAYPKIHPIP